MAVALEPRKVTTLQELDGLRSSVLEAREGLRKTVRVCVGTACTATGGVEVLNAFRKELEKSGRTDVRVETKGTGCRGFCELGPIVVVSPEELFYVKVTPDDVPELFEKSVVGDEAVERLLYVDPSTERGCRTWDEIPFYGKQERVVLRNNGLVDPTDILDYVSVGGYRAIWKALHEMEPGEIVTEVGESGLRGRGGAGFPTGRKWGFVRDAPGSEKYVVCNGDEGDPGAYMDRSVLEGDPHSVIEGMLIGARAMGASHGYFYVRTEYPLAVTNLSKALDDARAWGLLGKDIYGSGFSFDAELVQGSGAFVCGEETALIASIEGRRGMPRARPPYPAHSGVWGKPTCINNVETWANVPEIITRGATWFRSIGTETSPGTKIFSLVGKVRNTGLVEVPMGITLREIVFDIGGGILDGRGFKAVQTGGPSGGCIPKGFLDSPVDYDALTELGSMMGSGGMVVMDDATCMVDVARFFLEFTQAESCGKCTFCRIGTRRMLETLTRITQGEGRDGDIELLEELATAVRKAALCGLGQTAPNPVLTTLKYFRDEYVAHISDRRCPALACRKLITYAVDPEACTGCHACFKACPAGAVSGEVKHPHTIDQEKCIHCGACHDACRFDAVKRE